MILSIFWLHLLMLSTFETNMDQRFESVNFGYSTKNIPIPKQKDYLKCLISKAEKFMRNIRWRTFFFLNPDIQAEDKETYGFNSTKSPPYIPELKQFEDGMLDIVQNIEFLSTSKPFQNQLRKDRQNIRNDSNLFVAADKTTNFYKLEPDQYNNLLKQNITKDYKKAPKTSENTITLEDKYIASTLDISDRIDTTAKSQAFITLKDHKPNFQNKPTCRLINPCKSEIGKISKQILERINSKIINATKFNQWKNTDEVISWYKNLQNKKDYSFICFDICEFYPSISEDLLSKALDYASRYDNISDHERHIILHAKKAILYNSESPWCKRRNPGFDVTMGSFDGAETCELIGLYLLSQLQHLNINVGLYRDDGLAVCRATSRQIEITKKKICQIFSENNLHITVEANKKSVDFLDITLDLRSGTYEPFMKDNNTPLYVHKDSNHPPSIIRNIPEGINKRLSRISSNRAVFDRAKPVYQDALNRSGYNYELKYQEHQPKTKRKRTRTRKITWFNPPHSDNVKTNIGKKFFNLLDKSFPPSHQLHKLLNRNTVKISYSCMPNIHQIVSSHNKRLINKPEPNTNINENCNCKRDRQCPLNGNCLTSSVIYQAKVTRHDNQREETYVGLTENTFKSRFNGHTSSFRNEEHRKATTLSEYIWKLKDKNIQHSITWKILSRAKPYSTIRKTCNLCLEEKFFIIHRPHLSSLNKRNELTSACRHRKKHLLCNYSNR
jgi:hypothetical protein